MGNFPTNVTLDIGGDGDIEWSEPGVFNYTYNLNTSIIMDELSNHTSPYRYYPWEYITVPMVFTSSTSGIIHIYGINITHNSPPFLNVTLPELELFEDTPTTFPIDLDDYFMDMDGDTLSYTVYNEVNVGVAILSNGIEITPDDDWYGEETFSIWAYDTDGEYGTGEVTVTVRSVNDPPVAAISYGPMNVSSGEEVTFSGANSTDKDGTVSHHIWDFGDGYMATGAVVRHAFQGGNRGYTVNLTVIDNEGGSGSREVTVSVGNTPPTAMVAVHDPSGVGFPSNTDVVIDLTGTGDGDGTISRFLLDYGDGYKLQQDGAPPMTVTHQYGDGILLPYTITLRVWDNNNATASATATVRINNVAPVIETVSAPSTVEVGKVVKFKVAANDSDGLITNYMWDFDGDGDFTWSSNLNGHATHKYNKTGTYRATLKIVDDDGSTAFYTVSIKVQEAAAGTDYGLAIALGLALIIAVVILLFIIFQQKGVIMRQKDLLVRRDEALRELQLEQEAEEETTGEEEIDRIAPKGGGVGAAPAKEAEVVEEEEEIEEGELEEELEEDLGTLEPMGDEEGPPEADEIMTPDTGKTTIAPSESTGIIPSDKPSGLGDMMGAAQASAVPVSAAAVVEEEEEEEEEETEAEEPVLEKEPVEERKVLAKAKCPGCKSVIPLYSLERPMRIKCDNCGKEGVIK